MTVTHTVIVRNKLGMHTRPAMKLFELVQRFYAEVMLRNESGVEAEASSADEAAALAAVIELFEAGFDEE
ncbi:HPr family phosphocarrier protein [Candidatus Symbiopectobacterium sp.]|uniref:HPr family phosphocarrier protein n=1 Tax=Candidatus Symbiopectobacterium sp. TaxID=2816440 RepID=UPI0025BC8D22|nr:HPr family phosphocarrier protein [Candidatus Symbiopectobacterium sp.]